MNINKPLSLKELKQGDLIPKGIYPFQIMSAEEAVSKSGNDMIKLNIKIWLEDGRERFVFDYLLEALEYKLGHFAEATELWEQYNEKKLNSCDCIGKQGKLKIGIQSDKTGQYPDKNVVVDYLPDINHTPSAMKPLPDVKKEFFDDSIPF